jgi:hypothetical protein
MHEELASQIDNRRRYIPWGWILASVVMIICVIFVVGVVNSLEQQEESKVVIEPTTYQVTTRCYNCFEILHLEIPFGLTYKQWLDKKGKCPHCRHILDKDTPLCQKQYGFFDNYRCGENNE